jgi:hypothetical protein
MYQEPGLRNGGLGDRIAGLLNAIVISLRFGRQLLVRDFSGLHKFFRPYHPYDIHNPTPKYTWDIGEPLFSGWNWSNYENHYQGNDDTEFDNWNCMNTNGNYNGACSMVNGDVSQPHILCRGNRAYFCYIQNHPGTPAYADFRDKLKIPEDADMFEVAGCMLRLAYWPTPFMWEAVEKVYQDFDISVQRPSNNYHHEHHLRSRSHVPGDASNRKLSEADTAAGANATSAYRADINVNDNANVSVQASESESKFLRGDESRERKRTSKSKSQSKSDVDAVRAMDGLKQVQHDEQPMGRQSTTPASAASTTTKSSSTASEEIASSISSNVPQTTEHVARKTKELISAEKQWKSLHHQTKYFQVGLHFRCGDMSFLSKDAADRMCIWDPDITDAGYLSNFEPGNPVEIASCADQAFQNVSTRLQQSLDDQGSVIPQSRDLMKNDKSVKRDLTVVANTPDYGIDPPDSEIPPDTISASEGTVPLDSTVKVSSSTPTSVATSTSIGLEHPANHLINTMLLVMSDNVKAAEQMSGVVAHPYTLIGPEGCHVELDQSEACHLFTVSYWFMLAMSDVIVTQQGPTSAFSRYAAVYGLKDNPIRSGKHCEVLHEMKQMGNVPMGNWFC